MRRLRLTARGIVGNFNAERHSRLIDHELWNQRGDCYETDCTKFRFHHPQLEQFWVGHYNIQHESFRGERGLDTCERLAECWAYFQIERRHSHSDPTQFDIFRNPSHALQI